jgi:hypothetical protein
LLCFDLFDPVILFIFALEQVLLYVFEGLVIECGRLVACLHEGSKMRYVDDWDPFADELLFEIVLTVHPDFSYEVMKLLTVNIQM